ncbi:MAG: Cys-tRNA(Pro) deacylase [Oscillospiraceae bacterium]|nr:Cys-tRNA(Pro) deacylase [Oscillospiraceae bacterium]
MSKGNKKTTNAARLLAGAGIEFELIEYEADEEIGENFGMRVSQKTGIPPEQSFKTLVAKGDKTGYMTVCVSVNSEIDLKKLARESGNKKTELIATKELLPVTGYIRGGVSPIGMKKKFPVYIDASCEKYEKTAISGGMCGVTLLLSREDLVKYTGAKVCDIAE